MIKTRETWDVYFMKMAKACAAQATCLRRRYGAVLVDSDRRIVATGYNGTPRHEPECIRTGFCWREENHIPSGENYEKCMSIHAEVNAISQAGSKAKGTSMFLYGFDANTGEDIDAYPCFMCSKLILNVSIICVYMSTSDGKITWKTPTDIYHANYIKTFGQDTFDIVYK